MSLKSLHRRGESSGQRGPSGSVKPFCRVRRANSGPRSRARKAWGGSDGQGEEDAEEDVRRQQDGGWSCAETLLNGRRTDDADAAARRQHPAGRASSASDRGAPAGSRISAHARTHVAWAGGAESHDPVARHIETDGRFDSEGPDGRAAVDRPMGRFAFRIWAGYRSGSVRNRSTAGCRRSRQRHDGASNAHAADGSRRSGRAASLTHD